MANIPFKSITFPGLPNKYTVPEISNDLMTAGKAADAKATGDALSALEDAVTEETDKLQADLGDLVNKESLELCDTETVPGSANMWDSSAITTGGGILANGNFNADERYCYEKITVTPGDTLYFYDLRQTNPSVQARWICAYDENDNAVTASGTNTGVKYFTVPSGIVKLAISTMLSYNEGFMVLVGQDSAPQSYIPYTEPYERYVATYDFVKNLDFGVTSVNTPVYENIETELTNTTGAIFNTGTKKTGGTYDTYYYSQKISVSEGDIVKPIGESGASFRFLCAYNGNTVIPSAGLTSGQPEYVVPSGIDGIVVTAAISYHVTAVSIKHIVGTEVKTYPKSKKLGKINWYGSLADGDVVEMLRANVRFNVVWAFTGHVTTMGKVTLGVKQYDNTVVELCSVDSTNVYFRNQSGTIISEAHGLTVSDDLQIRIDSKYLVNRLEKITIYSGGTSYTTVAVPYGYDMKGCAVLISDGAVMTDCVFSWIPRDIDKPIWVFGDSWGSMYDTRWVYYMTEAGYKDSWMLNAFAGEKTEQAYEALENLLTIRKPEYIVWMLGMNDADSGAVNVKWKAVYDKLTALCTAYDINLILYTVPNTPTIDNSYKNAIVTASGYRYIDGVAAVGDDGNGNWYTDYEQSASDHNHTSAKGARALFMRILTDFPEIASSGL